MGSDKMRSLIILWGSPISAYLLLPRLIFHHTSLDMEHGHLDDALDSPQQVYVVLERVSLAELHVGIDARPADHQGQDAPLLALLAVADGEVILDAPAEVDSMDDRVAGQDVGELLEPLGGRVLDLRGYVRREPDQEDLCHGGPQGFVGVWRQAEVLCEMVTA